MDAKTRMKIAEKLQSMVYVLFGLFLVLFLVHVLL